MSEHSAEEIVRFRVLYLLAISRGRGLPHASALERFVRETECNAAHKGLRLVVLSELERFSSFYSFP